MTLSRSRLATLVALAFLLAACSGGTATTGATGTPVSGGGGSASAPTPTPTATATATLTALPSPTPLPSLPPGFNACTLLTGDQVTAVNGSKYPAGVNHLLNGGFIECVWQTPTPPSSITVQVLSTSGDPAAEAAYAEAEASVHGFSLVSVTGVGDEAQIARAPGGVNTGGIYVRSGSIFFDVVYLNGTGANDAALQLAATEVMGNWP